MGEVLFSAKTSGLNFADILERQGLCYDAPKKPCASRYEVRGILEEVGAVLVYIESRSNNGKVVLVP